tara:strand:+ start:707 stop:2875 length:2169 start_codon:yes stop_codon:yes gene_type:complete
MMSLLKILFFLILISFFAINPAIAKTSPSIKNKPSSNSPIAVSADHIEQDSSKNIIRAIGHVIIRFKGKIIRADQVKINMKTGRGMAEGHVYIREGKIKLRAERSTFNMKKKTGKIYNVKGKLADDFLVSGKEVHKLTDEHYRMKNSTLTTCVGDFPDWIFEVDNMDVVIGDRALFKGATFKIRDVPVFHLPMGYVTLDKTRKSGLLVPDIGSSNLDGLFVNNSYYWAINRQSDATFMVDYLEKRGVRGGLEYRYKPSKETAGEFRGNYLEDNSTGNTFWKVDMTHRQVLPGDFKLDAKLDLVGDDNFDKTFNSVTTNRTRRSTDSYVLATKSWSNSTLDILTRFRNSTQDNRDDTFGILPKVTHKVQRTRIGNSGVYFNQETSYAMFITDLNPSINFNQEENIQRFDIHPQVSMPFRAASWLSINPTIGVRGTYYDKGFDSSFKEFDGFFRKSFDINTTIEGPRINKVFETDSKLFNRLNHILEPRIVYEYVPDIDSEQRGYIKKFDNVDKVDPLNKVTYSLNQRLLRKMLTGGKGVEADQLIRFEILQSYDISEMTKNLETGQKRRPFSDLRFDFDSRIYEPLLLNFDATYDVYDGKINTGNVLLGVKPSEWLTLMFERRWVKDSTTFIQGTVDMHLDKGWSLQYSTRYDELNAKFLENDVSLSFDNPCRCWGFGFDFIKRNNINGGLSQDDIRFMFRINLRGIGSFGTKKDEKLLHRNF